MGNWRERRAADLVRIQTARRRLGLDDATWEALLYGVSGAHGVRPEQMDASTLARLLGFLRGCGASRPEAETPPVETRSRPAHIGRLRALWGQLAAAGVVADGSAGALERFVLHHTGVTGVARLTTDQAAALLAELKGWRRGRHRRGKGR